MSGPRETGSSGADRPLLEITVGGGASGLVAGLLMALVATIASSAAGDGFWTPLRLIGATAYGPDAFVFPVAPILVGLGAHLLVSVFWSVLYSISVRPDTTVAGSFTGGLVYAVVVWALMTFTVVPWAAPMLAAHVQDVGGAWFLLHLVYGAGLAVTPAMERAAVGGPVRPPRPA